MNLKKRCAHRCMRRRHGRARRGTRRLRVFVLAASNCRSVRRYQRGSRAFAAAGRGSSLTLNDGAGLTATTNDIKENPYNIQFVETEAASVPRTLSDVDAAVINGNYALGAGLDPVDRVRC